MKKPIDQEYVRSLASQYVRKTKAKNAHFSLRAFAKRLEVSAGGMSSFLSGKKNYSARMLENIIEVIVDDPTEKQKILKHYNSLKMSDLTEYSHESPFTEQRLSEEEFHLIRDWHSFGLLFLIETMGFESSPEWIAKRLGLALPVVKKTIENLKAVKLINVSDEGVITKNGDTVRTTDNAPSESVRHMHKQLLQLSQNSLEETPLRMRDITSVTLAMNPKSLNKARQLVRKFHEDLTLLAATEEKTDVYNCSIAIFPLTH